MKRSIENKWACYASGAVAAAAGTMSAQAGVINKEVNLPFDRTTLEARMDFNSDGVIDYSLLRGEAAGKPETERDYVDLKQGESASYGNLGTTNRFVVNNLATDNTLSNLAVGTTVGPSSPLDNHLDYSGAGSQVYLYDERNPTKNNPVGPKGNFHPDNIVGNPEYIGVRFKAGTTGPDYYGWIAVDFDNKDDVAGHVLGYGYEDSGASILTGQTGAKWASAVSGSFSLASNWKNGIVPGGAGASANFTTPIAAGTVNVNSSSPLTLGSLYFDSPNTYNLTGSALTLTNSDGSKVNVVSGAHKISMATTLTDSITVIVADGASFEFAAPVTGTSATSLTKTGTGSLAVRSFAGGALAINSGTVSLPAAAHTVSIVEGLTLANDGGSLGARTYTASLDVGNSDVVIRNGSLVDVSDMARAGQNGGSLFAGVGLTSGVAAADAAGQLRYAVGVIQNNIDGSTLYDTFDGVNVGLTDVLVKFTYFGDADLNGLVDDTDFFLVNNGYGNGLTGWVNGDVDYSGTVDDTDFFLINNAYGLQGPALRAGGSVPEPTGMALMALAAGFVVGGRRR